MKVQFFLFLALFVTLLNLTPVAASGTETQITNNSKSQDFPSVYANYMVWQDNRNGNWDIFIYDKSTQKESPLITNTANQINPQIYGNIVVWQDDRGGNGDIFYYDLTNEKEVQLTNDPAHQMEPAINGNIIVWQDKRNGNQDIYSYDLAKGIEKAITADPYTQTAPAIFGNKVVWQDYRNGNWDIFSYDLSSGNELQITSNTTDETEPSIYGDSIIWQDMRNGNNDIYHYDFPTGKTTLIAGGNSDQISPQIYANTIIWHDNQAGNWDIYGYDIANGTSYPIISNTAHQYHAVVYEKTIVWADLRNGNFDIYFNGILPSLPPSLPPSPTVDITPPSLMVNIDKLYALNSKWLFDYTATDSESGIKNVSATFNGISISKGSTLYFKNLGVNELKLTATDYANNTTVITKTVDVYLPVSINLSSSEIKLNDLTGDLIVSFYLPSSYPKTPLIDTVQLNGVKAYSWFVKYSKLNYKFRKTNLAQVLPQGGVAPLQFMGYTGSYYIIGNSSITVK